MENGNHIYPERMNDSNNASSMGDTHQMPHIDGEVKVTPQEGSQSNGGAKHISKTLPSEEHKDILFGWGPYRPQFLQFLNKPHWFLVFLCIFAVTQGITVNGLVYVITTTLEKRFQLPSVYSGSISSAYDFSVMIVIIFVTYYGENRHKPLLLSIGTFLFGCGSILFSVPHYTTPLYEFTSSSNEFCDVNREPPECDNEQSSLSRYFWLFVLAQFLHGLGASPLYTLGITYIDENVRPKFTGVYIGVFNGASLLGPAIGYLIGGVFLDIYTDVRVDSSTLNIDSDNPVFIGAWWIGFIMTSFLAFSLVVPFLAFPKTLPGSKEIAKERVSEVHGGSDFSSRAGFGGSIMDFPKAALVLIKNLPFLCICAAACTEWFLLAGFAVFAPKYLESQFSLSSSWAAVLVGLTVIPAGVGGSVTGGFVVKVFNLRFKGMIRFCICAIFGSFLLMSVFFITCPDPLFAGVTLDYGETEIPEGVVLHERDLQINSTCNNACACDNIYQPVCGDDGITYFSPCYAGCTEKIGDGPNMTYIGCSCVLSSNPTVKLDKCDSTCNSLAFFCIMLFLMEFSTILAVVPSTTATLRCIPHSQRSLGLGLQSLLYRALGTVPGPIIMGAIIDGACLLRQPSCDDSVNTCWLYTNSVFSRSMLVLALCIKIFSILFFVGALLFYKAPEATKPAKGGGKEVDGGGVDTVTL